MGFSLRKTNTAKGSDHTADTQFHLTQFIKRNPPATCADVCSIFTGFNITFIIHLYGKHTKRTVGPRVKDILRHVAGGPAGGGVFSFRHLNYDGTRRKAKRCGAKEPGNSRVFPGTVRLKAQPAGRWREIRSCSHSPRAGLSDTACQ